MLCLLILAWLASPVESADFAPLRRTNQEVFLQLTAPTGLTYRIDGSTNYPEWSAMATLLSTGQIQHLDSAAPFLNRRYYRAEQLSGTNVLTGDHLATTNGDVVIHPVGHASFVMSWNGKMIYNDPTNGAAAYQTFPRADLILVSHSHGDHFSGSTLDAVRGSNAVIIVPQAVYNALTTAQRTNVIVLTNGASTNVMGLSVAAVPAYNLTSSYHLKGAGNGYVLTIAGKRLFISGDTEDVPEIRGLQNIDLAFLCINLPYTMSVSQASSTVRQFRPKIIYPYHYRNSDNTLSDLNAFKSQVGTDLGIEVRLRKWY